MIEIYTSKITPRLRYVCSFIFDEFLGLEFVLSSDKSSVSALCINYSKEEITNAFRILPSGLLEEEGISIKKVDERFFGDDIFSSVFYLLSRYEEYLPFTADKHERFPATESVLFKYNLLEKPIVDQWIIAFGEKLKTHFPSLKIKRRTFSYRSTIDVDNAYAFKGKSLVRLLGALAKEILGGKIKDVQRRINYFFGRERDPFDAYAFHLATAKKYQVPLTYFFLFAESEKHDRSINPKSKAMQELLNFVALSSEVGVHPSYASYDNEAKVRQEINSMSSTLQKRITQSRQHFLKLKFPHTFQNLISCGITEEYSMGYSTHAGFRAGTCTPFCFFDLLKNETTKLKIIPFQVMDSLYFDQQKLSAGEAIKNILKIVDEVKNVQGTFVSVWHDRSFDSLTYRGWIENYVKLHAYCLNGELP